MRNLLLTVAWIMLVFVGFYASACGDRILSPAQARAIPGSFDFCQIAETGFVTASDRSEQLHFQRQLEDHCFGKLGEDGKPEIKEPAKGEDE